MSKSLDIKIRETKDFGAHALNCANRYGLDHDCAGYGLCTRLDVTAVCEILETALVPQRALFCFKPYVYGITVSVVRKPCPLKEA